MKLLQYAIECLFIILFQMSLVPSLPFSEYIFDPAIPYVLYISLFRPGRSVFMVSFVLGLLMDGISGAHFGLFTTTYLWMMVAVRQITTLIRMDQTWMLQLFTGLGVLFEEMVLLGMTALIDPGFRIPITAVERIGIQVLLAVLFVPFLFSLLRLFQAVWDASVNRSQPGPRRKRWLTTSNA